MSALPGFVVHPLEQLTRWVDPAWVPPPERKPAPVLPPPPKLDKDRLQFPPGNAGALAHFLHEHALRPVPEIAIATALGWLAGTCGKSYVTSWANKPTGLNLYLVLIARSAIGKEAINEGLTTLSDALVKAGCAWAPHRVNFNDMVSGPALRKAVLKNPCFLNVYGEFGKNLERMARAEQSGTDGPMSSLRKELTDLYHKSGPGSTAGGMQYSKDADSVAAVGSVAYSLLGDSQPSVWRAAVTEGMFSDGFMSRLCVVEYTGDRPPLNGAIEKDIPEGVREWLTNVCVQAHTLLHSQQTVPVLHDAEAAALLDAFSNECDAEINKAGDNEALRQVWSRAHLKALKVANLLAVADNELNPLTHKHHAEWAIDLVRRDIRLFTTQHANGEIGEGDNAREKTLLRYCKEYLSSKGAPHGYGVPDAMHAEGVIPRKYFQQRTSSLAAFKNHRLGATPALDMAIRSLCDSGYLLEVDKLKAADSFGFQGKCFRITNLPGDLLR